MATEEVERLLQQLMAQVYELEQTLADFQQLDTQQPLLLERLREFGESLQRLREAAPACRGLQLPAELLKWVDGGGHPELYIKQAFADARRDNQLVKGRVEAIGQLRDKLLAEAEAAYPGDAAAYRSAVAGAATPAAYASGGGAQ